MKLLLVLSSLLAAGSGFGSEPAATTASSNPTSMSTPPPTLGYAILYVKDVAASLAFYEQAFGLTRRFFNDENGKAYGELETGAARLAFYSHALAKDQIPEIRFAAPDQPPLGCEIALVTPDVPALFARAVQAGAIIVGEPVVKPWGQTVACVRDRDGHTIELCTPLP